MNARSTLDTQLPAADLREIDAICDRFEADCRAGRQADLASYLAGVSHVARAVLFRDLLHLDLELCVKNGQQTDARSYYQRFPDLADVIDAAFEARNTRVTTARAASRVIRMVC